MRGVFVCVCGGVCLSRVWGGGGGGGGLVIGPALRTGPATPRARGRAPAGGRPLMRRRGAP